MTDFSRNYSTHVLDFWSDPKRQSLIQRAFPISSRGIIPRVMGLLTMADKYLMPDYGRVFAKGGQRGDFRDLLVLPAAVVALEYHCPRWLKPNASGVREHPYYPKRRVALCIDCQHEMIRDIPELAELHGIIVVSMFENAPDEWTFAPCAALLKPDEIKIDEATGNFDFVPLPLIKELLVRPIGGRTYSEADAVVDLSDEVIAAVEFMITVNCENVTKERISAPDKLNKKREAKQKAPFFSYWILNIFKEAYARRAPQGGTHGSPRFHFRRRHLRRYRNDDGSIKFTRIIDRMAVGNPTRGVVEKDYSLEKTMKKEAA
jgi:hypothetical protein